ncbi:MAG TPA: SDR family oxidoreductase [Thermoanaerobaculia bacterium]|jgi:NAD(P)-dependent dehydrogenase (short-subunit alcohol dehydrogenase family)
MQTVAITGGAGGLGGAVVERLSRSYRCIVLDRARIDVTDEESMRKAFAELGSHYALVHLVGAWSGGTASETSLETWSRMLALNLTGAFLAIRESLAHLTRPGRIVAVSSIASLTPAPGSAAYTVAKSALNMLIQTVAEEQRGSGITANAVLPDAMATPAMLRDGDASKLVPPEEVAETIAFLLSERAAHITGSLIPHRK